MKTPQQIKNEVEKEIERLGNTPAKLVDIMFDDSENNRRLDIEEAKLSILTEYDKSIKEMIEDFYNEFDLASNCDKDDKLFKRLWEKYFQQEGNILGISEMEKGVNNSPADKELLSKIGDNSEVEK